FRRVLFRSEAGAPGHRPTDPHTPTGPTESGCWPTPPRTIHPTSPTTPPTCPAGHSAPAEHPQPDTTHKSHRSAERTSSASPEQNTPPAQSAPRLTTPSSAGEHEPAPPQ